MATLSARSSWRALLLAASGGFVVLGLAACGGGGAGGTAGAGGAAGAGGGGGAGGSTPPPDVTGLAVNEIHPADEWVELVNTGSAPIQLDGLRLADDDAGAPKEAEAVTFPPGTLVPPGGYVLVGGKDTCPADTNGAPCFPAAFGISGANGDVVYLLAEAGTVLLSQGYPAGAVVDPLLSYGRLPSGTGSFTVTAPTPGAANAAP
jgi:hypothetical protein